jgi:uncharacterized protein YdaU (DUF1376 family)
VSVKTKMFSKQHYIILADTIGKAIANEENLENLIEDLTTLFTQDNTNFDNKRFKDSIQAAKERQVEKQKEILSNIMINIARRGAT